MQVTGFTKILNFILDQQIIVYFFSCGIQDLTLTNSADQQRSKLLVQVSQDAESGLAAFIDSTQAKSSEHKSDKSIESQIALFMSVNRKDSKIKLDGVMQSIINKSASEVIKVCIPNGLESPFLKNNFSIMVLTGAKGSAVNQSQISCFLGQQALEGQRVPIMISGFFSHKKI
jgi:DNA-directed RNA polymerase I subunit RPA1